MASVSGALRPCVLPLGAFRSLPGSQKSHSAARALQSLVQGRKGLVTRTNWNSRSTSLDGKVEQALFSALAVDDINHGLITSRHFSRFFSVKAVAGDAPPATAEPEVLSNQREEELQGEDEDPDSPPTWTIKLLYDGDCPLCMREVNFLRERNKTYRTLKLVDINSESYNPEENGGITYAKAMGLIHGILRDGTVLEGVPVFKKVYEEVGLGWVYAVTSIGPIGKLADALYDVWAKYRLPMTGRPPLVEVLEARRQKKAAAEECSDGCKIDFDLGNETKKL
ncbi:hypothetical protein R1sor_014228 [Riccia sorocarpa]|uniref:Thiol-disulfide oxidoreductase DCC n=1 Tax=Riccia sorocarpa TaxID=122646 RepID=A0ABD3HEX9_9MARC